MIKFSSLFCKEIEDFLSLRQASRSKSTYAHDCKYLADFDRIAATYADEKHVSEALVNAWLHTRKGKRSSIANEVIAVRIFLKYLNGIGIDAYIPPVPKLVDDYVPYIFSDEELGRIFELADSFDVSKVRKNPLIKYEFPMIIRLMYGCGLRIGETCALRMKDVDLACGILTMRQTKGDKQRLVPMHSLLTETLQRYCLAMGLIGCPEKYLFPILDKDEAVSPKDAQHCFEKVLQLSQISLAGRQKHERGPCLHCMRHVFVFKSFSAAERAGRSIDDSAPYLSIYLGHDSLQETEKYMKFSSELFHNEMERFADYSSDVFPEVSYEA